LRTHGLTAGGERFGGLSPEHRKYRGWGCTYFLRYRDHSASKHLVRQGAIFPAFCRKSLTASGKRFGGGRK
jgi:hypothetical protein